MVEPFPRPIDASTRYCAVLGHPIRHSASPSMQNAGLAALALNWRYLAFDVHPERLGAAIEGAKQLKFIGLNLTVPHKLLAMELVDELDGEAKAFGAVNTIRFEGRDTRGEWAGLGHFDAPPAEIRAHGFNTDAEAILEALRADLDFSPANTSIMLLGAGGAGRVAALKLAAAGAKTLYLINRTREKAERIAEQIKRQSPQTEVYLDYPGGCVDLVLNATSLGLKPDDPLPLELTRWPLNRGNAVFDMIYRPAETPLLAAARHSGCQTANGLSMLLHQGTRAMEIWTGKPAPVEIMRKALKKNVSLS